MKLRILFFFVGIALSAAIGGCRTSSRKTVEPITGEAATNVTVRHYDSLDLAHGRTKPIREIASRYVPRPTAETHVENEQTSLPDRKYVRQPDGALQTHALPGTFSATIGLSFDALSSFGYYPSDANGAVGTTQYVEVVNNEFAVYEKTTGNIAMGPVATNALWSALPSGTQCEARDDGDATVSFDKLAKRWVIQQMVSKAPFYICVAVSTTDDATGAWNAYPFSFNFGSTYFADYPKLGIWPGDVSNQFPQGVYLLSASIHVGNPGPYNGPVVCFMDRGAMLAGLSATQSQCSGLPPAFNPLIPADLDGFEPPRPGQSGLFMTWDPNGGQIDLITLMPCYPSCSKVDKRALAAPAFTPYFAIAGNGPNCNYNGSGVPPRGSGKCDIPEASGDGTYLDSLSIYPMYRLAFRRLSAHRESLVFNHTVLGVINGTAQVSAVRWYEIDTYTIPKVVQAGTFAPDYQWRWMGSTAMDRMGDQALGYSLSPTQISGYPGPEIAITGRTPSDATGTMESENVIRTNHFYQNGGNTRWGDYSSMQIDPVDDCTFWYTSQYVSQTGPSNWGTHVVTFKFPGCG